MGGEVTEALRTFFESFELFQSALVSAAVAGLVLGAIGVYVVAQRIVFLSAALSQTASLGVVLAFWLHQVADAHDGFFLAPSLWAFLASLAAVFVLTRSKDRDGLLGVVFLIGAAGTLTVATRIVEELQDVSTLLFGTAVAVPESDMWELVIVLSIVMAIHIWWFRGFSAVTLDRIGAQVRKMPTEILQLSLLASIALAISVTTRILGALPAFAFSVVPALVALSIARTFVWSFVIAGAVGLVSGVLGYIVAYLLDFPVGASQAGIAVTIYILLSPFRRRN